MEDQIDETAQTEEVEVVKPKGFNYHLIYSILPFIIVIGSLFVGKLAVDYLSRDEAPKDEIAMEVSPTPEPTIASPSITLRTSPTPSPSPTARPEDPLVSDTQRRYTNGNAGISFLYPKDWSVEGESTDAIDNKPSFTLNLTSNKVAVFGMMHNPYEFYHPPIKRTEKLVVGGKESELKVTGFCTEEEQKNALVSCDETGQLVVQTGHFSVDVWIFTMPVKTQDDTDAAIQRMKDILSTVKFL